MARLIPSFIPGDAPPGEKSLFDRLAGAPTDWVVIHALDLAPWNCRRRTELDFLVLIPQAGILCIEVKSHPEIAFDGGQWFPQTLKQGPFKQALDARYAFRRRIVDLQSSARRIPIVHCCVFPFAVFDVAENASISRNEVIDRRAWDSLRTPQEFANDLVRRMRLLIEEDPMLSPLTIPLAAAQIDEIVSKCLPIRKRRPEFAVEKEMREHTLDATLRTQQKPVLRLADDNSRILVEGGAGTGKTFMAMEIARRASERGGRCALLCFNSLVGSWMAKGLNALPAPPGLVVGSAHQILRQMLGIEVPVPVPLGYWDEEFLDQAEEILTMPNEVSGSFDYLVMDEAQDILARPRLLACVSQLLNGGIESGSMALFGDLDRQVLTDRPMLLRSIEALSNKPLAKWTLDENCRNVRVIGETALRLSGFPRSVYSDYVRGSGSQFDIDFLTWDSTKDQDEQVGTVLSEFLARGYKAHEITLVSCVAAARSAGARLSKAGRHLGPYTLDLRQTGYSSVFAFKGMENRVILVTDVEVNGSGFDRELFYTAMTRATDAVRVFVNGRSMETIHDWLRGGDA